MSSRKLISRRISQLINYSIPSYLSSFFSLLIFPFIAINLGVLELGKYELILAFIAALGLLSEFGIPDGFTRFLRDYKNPQLLTSTILISRLFVYLIIFLMIIFFLIKLNHFLHWNFLHIQ